MMNKFFGSLLVVVIIGCPTLVGKIVQTKVWHPTEMEQSPFQITSITPKTPQDYILLGQKININTASAETLKVIPGIGKSLAQKIVNYRSKNGAFKSLDELDAVNGVGPKKLETLQQLTSF